MIVNDAIEGFYDKQVLAKNIADNLKTANVKIPHFYITFKIHKRDIPGQLVVSSIDCHASKLSKFVDQYLQPHAKDTYVKNVYVKNTSMRHFFVKNTTYFIRKIKNIKGTSQDSILVTLYRCKSTLH